MAKCLGVTYYGLKDQWKARIRRNGKREYIPGYFDTAEEAAAAIERAGGYEL
jgi:hypothetical protein